MTAPNVTITDNIAETLSQFLRAESFSKIAVLVDENTQLHCYPVIASHLPNHSVCQVESGEVHKNLATCIRIWEHLTEHQFDRKALLINLGGGVIGDMGGFCAATYKRGIRFINIPTTLLSQVDASVGGKLGIDFHGYKNHIGLFQEPLRVMIDATFLKTLPIRELRSGFAETIKHSLIADADYWPTIRDTPFEQQDWQQIIAHSVAIKSKVVAEDFRESGRRKILNFGHTIGHAVESHFLDTKRPFLHGEAIAIGMIAEGFLSERHTKLPSADKEAVKAFLLKTYGYHPIPEEALVDIIALAGQDKKNTQAKIQCTLLERIGRATFDIPITEKDIEAGIAYYNA